MNNNNNEELKKATVEHNGKTKTFTYSKEVEETLMKQHGFSPEFIMNEMKNAGKMVMEMAEEKNNNEVLFQPDAYYDDIGDGTQRIKKIYVENGKICLDLAHAYYINLKPDEAKKLIDILSKGIENISK